MGLTGGRGMVFWVQCSTLRVFLVSFEGGLGTVSHSQSILG